jgi:hypothetical protein
VVSAHVLDSSHEAGAASSGWLISSIDLRPGKIVVAYLLPAWLTPRASVGSNCVRHSRASQVNHENGRDPTQWLFGFKPLPLLVFTLIVVLSGSAAWMWFSARDHILSEKPPRSATSPEIPIASSSVAATATIAYSALTDALNKEVPATFNADGRQQVCADLNEAVRQTVQKKVGGDVGKIVGKAAKVVTQVITVNQVRHVCQDVDYKVTVTRTAPVTVSRSGDKVHISTT